MLDLNTSPRVTPLRAVALPTELLGFRSHVGGSTAVRAADVGRRGQRRHRRTVRIDADKQRDHLPDAVPCDGYRATG